MHSISIWEKNTFFKPVDVAIIGSGIVGLTTAIFLKQKWPNLQVSIFERGPLPSGASTKNAGFACFGSMTELVDDEKERGQSAVFDLVKMRWNGLLTLRKLLGDQSIHFQQNGNYELFRPEDKNAYEECLNKMEAYNDILHDIIGKKSVFQTCDHLIPRFGFGQTQHMIVNNAEGQINTGQMMKGLLDLARNLEINIWNGLPVKRIDEKGEAANLLISDNLSIKAKKIVVATNGFSSKFFENLDLKPARNQVIVTEPIENLPFNSCFHLDRGYYYFRSIETEKKNWKRILFGGGRNLAIVEETTSEFGETDIIQRDLEKKLKEIIFPQKSVKIDLKWSGILGVGQSKEPIMKKVSPSVYTAIRLGGMGVAIGSLLGQKTADMVISDL